MQTENAWDTFKNSGRIEDYIAFYNLRADALRQSAKEDEDASEHRRTDHPRTEYR